MRTLLFYRGDSGDTGDKAVITVSRRVPTTKTVGGNTGDNVTPNGVDGFLSPEMSPIAGKRVGTCGSPMFIGMSPVSPGVPSKNVDLDCSTKTTRLMSWSERKTTARDWRGGVKPAKAEA
jgi:hypothetical protein